MKSSLGKHQAQSPSNDAEMLRMNKNLIMEQRKIVIDLNLVISPEFISYLSAYAKKHYNIELNMKGK